MVRAIAGEGSSFRYTYDFGDGWDHKIVVEKVLPADSSSTVPACIDGRRACPPEDCGGTWGYRELLEILADPTHPERETGPSSTSPGSTAAARRAFSSTSSRTELATR